MMQHLRNICLVVLNLIFINGAYTAAHYVDKNAKRFKWWNELG